MAIVEALLQRFPELSIFISIAGGALIGRLKIGWLRLGTATGTLLAAMLIARFRVQPDPGFVAVSFALFAYALGYEVGPDLPRAFHREGLRALLLACFVAGATLLSVVLVAKLLGWDAARTAGFAAGIVAQLPLLGTADQALRTSVGASTALHDAQVELLVGFVVTYIPGLLAVALVCTRLTAALLQRDLRRDAVRAGQLLAHRPGLPEDTRPILPPLVGRAYSVSQAAERTISSLEQAVDGSATIESIERAGERLSPAPMFALEREDRVVIAGRRAGVIALGKLIGSEDASARDPGVPIARARVVLTATEYAHRSLLEVRDCIDRTVRHGVYLGRAMRSGRLLPLYPNTQLEVGDVLELYGLERDVRRVSAHVGRLLEESEHTDLAYLGAGACAGVVLGALPLGAIGGSLGLGVGALVAGAVFGWLRARGRGFGALPSAAGKTLKELGLASTLAALGLVAGERAFEVIRSDAPALFAAGIGVSLLVLSSALLFGRFVLGLRNAALLSGFLCGACASPAALEELTTLADHQSPTIPFGPTYAIACIALSLLGPLLVAIL